MTEDISGPFSLQARFLLCVLNIVQLLSRTACLASLSADRASGIRTHDAQPVHRILAMSTRTGVCDWHRRWLSLCAFSGHLANILLDQNWSGHRPGCKRELDGWYVFLTIVINSAQQLTRGDRYYLPHHVLPTYQPREPWFRLVSADLGFHGTGYFAHPRLLDAAESEAAKT